MSRVSGLGSKKAQALTAVTGLSIAIRGLFAASLAGIKMATSGPPFYAAAQCAP